MKKTLLIAALTARLLGAAAAAAYPAGIAQRMQLNLGFGAALNAGDLTAAGVLSAGPGLGDPCIYPTVWQSPFADGNAIFCALEESKNVVSPSCPLNGTMYRAGSFLSSPPSGCAGFDPSGTQYPGGITIIAVEGAISAIGIIAYPAPLGGPYPLIMDPPRRVAITHVSPKVPTRSIPREATDSLEVPR